MKKALFSLLIVLPNAAQAVSLFDNQYKPECIQIELRTVFNSDNVSIRKNTARTNWEVTIQTAKNLLLFIPRATSPDVDFPEVIPNMDIVTLGIQKKEQRIYAQCAIYESYSSFTIDSCRFYAQPYQIKAFFTDDIPGYVFLNKDRLNACTAGKQSSGQADTSRVNEAGT
jgi:hypothetical protein